MKKIFLATALVSSFASAELIKFDSGEILTADALNHNFQQLKESEHLGSFTKQGECMLIPNNENSIIGTTYTVSETHKYTRIHSISPEYDGDTHRMTMSTTAFHVTDSTSGRSSNVKIHGYDAVAVIAMDGDEWADGTFSIKIGEYGYVYASLRKEDLPDNMWSGDFKKDHDMMIQAITDCTSIEQL